MDMRMEVIVLMVALAFSLMGCPKSGPEARDANETTADQFKQRAEEALQASASYLAEQKDKLLGTSREQLDKLEAQFDAWADEVDTEDDQVKQELSRFAETFEMALNQARQTIDKAGELGLEAWRDAKPSLEAALGEAREAYDEFMAFVKAQTQQADPVVEE